MREREGERESKNERKKQKEKKKRKGRKINFQVLIELFCSLRPFDSKRKQLVHFCPP